MDTLNHLLENNQNWAKRIDEEKPGFFQKLSKLQKPEYLWIGCADSRVSADAIVDLPPGEVFVHRNIANLVVHTDLNSLSVIQYAVEVLKVKHIIVCGHYGCGGVAAAMDKKKHGLIDNWLRHIRDVYRFHETQLNAIEDLTERENRLCELNVIEQVANVCNSTMVKEAWHRKQPLFVHGLIYRLEDGLLRDLGVTVSQ